MKLYDFTLTFQINNNNINPELYLDKLYESGCDDAVIGLGKPGYLSLNFMRESNSAFDAVQSAIKNVKEVLNDAQLIMTEPYLVGVSDLAEITKCSRQNIQKMINKSDFPSAIYKGHQAIWYLAEVLKWLENNHKSNLSPEYLELVDLLWQINIQIENKMANPDTLEKAKQLVA